MKTGIDRTYGGRKTLFETRMMKNMIEDSRWLKFHGKKNDPNALIWVKEIGDKADRQNFDFRDRLKGDGVTSGESIEGKQEELQHFNQMVQLEEYVNEVKVIDVLAGRRLAPTLDRSIESSLTDWSTEKLDKLHNQSMTSTPSFIVYNDGTGAFKVTSTMSTAQTAVDTATYIMTPTILRYLKNYAKGTGNNDEKYRMKPIKIKGKDYWFYLCSDDTVDDLRKSTEIVNAHTYAMQRGIDNPIFNLVDLVFDSILIVGTDNKELVGLNGSIPITKGLFMGRGAMSFLWGQKVKLNPYYTEGTRVKHHQVQFICGMEKTRYNSKDYSCIMTYTARTRVQDTAIA